LRTATFIPGVPPGSLATLVKTAIGHESRKRHHDITESASTITAGANVLFRKSGSVVRNEKPMASKRR